MIPPAIPANITPIKKPSCEAVVPRTNPLPHALDKPHKKMKPIKVKALFKNPPIPLFSELSVLLLLNSVLVLILDALFICVD